MTRFPMLVVFMLSLLPAGLFASVIPVSDQEMAGRADLIVIGRVEKVWEKHELPSWVTDPSGWAEVTVEKVDKGPKITKVTLRFFTGENKPGVTDVQTGQRRLFLLERVRGGYMPIGVFQGIRPVEDAGHFTELLRAFPVELTFLKPPGPITFGNSTTIQFNITNRSSKPVQILPNPMLWGYLQVAEMERYRSFVNMTKTVEGDGKTRALAAGKSLTLAFNVRGVAPKQWKNRISTPVDVRIAVWIVPSGNTERFQVFSAWKTTSVGYAH